MKDFLYDGSFEGLLSAIFHAYTYKGEAYIYKEKDYVPHLLGESVLIETETDKANRVYISIKSKLSAKTLSHIYHLYLSSIENVETLILDYIKLCYKYSDSINLAKNNPIIADVDKYTRRVLLEAERFRGFVRFKEISPLTFYAPIEPDHNILPLLASHFKIRFSDQHFIIHDLKRQLALVYDTKTIFIQTLTADENTRLAKLDIKDPFEELFKSFYESTTISERINEKRRRNYMPQRYFKHLVEL